MKMVVISLHENGRVISPETVSIHLKLWDLLNKQLHWIGPLDLLEYTFILNKSIRF